MNMSYILSQIAKKKIPKWNEKVLDMEDFETLCEAEEVRVLETSAKHKGEYCIYRNQPFILLKKNLKPNLKTWIAWHELAHHFLHYPATHHFSRSTFRRMDREANFVAAIALMPSSLVKNLTMAEIIGDYEYPIALVEIRKEIFEEFKL